MNKQTCSRIAIAFAIILGPSSWVATAATIIFDNGAPCSCASPGSDLSLENDFGHLQSADDFELLPGATAITDMHWWGFYNDGNSSEPGSGDSLAADDFRARFFMDDGGEPAGSPFAEFVLGSVMRSPYPLGRGSIFQYDADLGAALSLAPGVTYWLSIVNNTPGDPDDWYWQTATLFDGGNYASRFGDGPWFDGTQELAFNLTGPDGPGGPAVPEPGTLLLLATGAAGLVARRRRG